MRYLFLLTILVLIKVFVPDLRGQTTINGRVIDEITGAPVAYATVSALGTPNNRPRGGGGGVYSREDGTFTLVVHKTDSLRVAMLGYNARTVPAEDGLVCALPPKRYDLQKIVVTDRPRKPRKVKYGNSRYAFNGYSGWWGGIVARRVGQDATKSGVLKKAVYRLDVNGNDCSVLARVRLFASAGNRPGSDLLHNNVLIKLKGGKNKYEVDLSDEQIVFPPGGLYVGVEFLVPGADCAEVEDGKRRFYVLTGKTNDPRTWKRRSGGEWGPLVLFREAKRVNARFAVEVEY